VKYKETIIELKKNQNMARVKLVIERAKRLGYVAIFPIETVPDGIVDSRIGLSGSDVQGFWDFYWWKRENWKGLLEAIKNYFEDIDEFIIDGFFKRIQNNIKGVLNTAYKWIFIYHPFRITYKGWIWVCDSKCSVMESESWELAADILAQEMGYEDSSDYYCKTRRTLYSFKNESDKIKSLANKLKKEEPDRIWEYFVKNNEYVQVADYMWVNKNDSTCFVVDEKIVPFDLRDGWSAQGLTKPIAAWLKIMYDLELIVRYVENEND